MSAPHPSDPAEAEAIALLDAELEGSPYHVLALVGRGGMGAVYEVEHRTLRRRFVLKLLREPQRRDLEDRLRLEAQTLAQLSHPNLPAVVDFSRTRAGRPYLVLERLRGQTLRERCGAVGALSVREAVIYAIQALSGLAAAHRAGVVHRDVKLDNLFLCEAEGQPPRVVVIDFGIAKVLGAPGGVEVAPLEVPTAEGVMMGTPSFMSPEQITHQRVDHRADLYGVGVVLYRLLTGRPPFIARDLLEHAAAHATEIPTPPSRWAALPQGLDAAVLRALEKRPEDRYPDAGAMIAALQPFAEVEGGAGPRPSATSDEVAPESLPTNPLPGRAVAAGKTLVAAPPAWQVAPPPLRPPVATPRLPLGATVPLLEPPRALDRRIPRGTERLPTPPAAVHAVPPPAPHPATLEVTHVRPPRRLPVGPVELFALAVAAVAVAAIGWFSLELLGVLP